MPKTVAAVTISEEDCVACGDWPKADRWAKRMLIDSLPLQEESICDECLVAFWQNCVVEPEPDEPSKH